MTTSISREPFDPLVDLDGLWTPELAERYLPIDGAPPTRYEAVNGKLVMSPREGSANSWAALELGTIMRMPARRAGHGMYSALNVRLTPDSWIEPDLVVLRKPVRNQTWIPAWAVLMPVEFVSMSSRRRDRIDKPLLAAIAEIPYYLRVEIDRVQNAAEVHLFELCGEDYAPLASALAGETFTMPRPFEVSFDPGDLLEP